MEPCPASTGCAKPALTIRLDAESEERLFDRIMREAGDTGAPRAGDVGNPHWRFGGLALAATLLIGGRRYPRPAGDDVPEAGAAPLSRSGDQAVVGTSVPPPSRAAVLIAFTKPEVKLSPSALTWRGDPSANPFLRDLAPAIRRLSCE